MLAGLIVNICIGGKITVIPIIHIWQSVNYCHPAFTLSVIMYLDTQSEEVIVD